MYIFYPHDKLWKQLLLISPVFPKRHQAPESVNDCSEGLVKQTWVFTLHIPKKGVVLAGSWNCILGPDEKGFVWWRSWTRLNQYDQRVYTNNVTFGDAHCCMPEVLGMLYQFHL